MVLVGQKRLSMSQLRTREHHLKSWPQQFRAVKYGKKRFEFRLDDRGFEVGHNVILEEYDPLTKQYSGDNLRVVIKYVLRGPDFGVPSGFVIFNW